MANFALSDPGPSAVASSVACPDGGQLPIKSVYPCKLVAPRMHEVQHEQLLTYAQYWTLAPAACKTATTSMCVLA